MNGRALLEGKDRTGRVGRGAPVAQLLWIGLPGVDVDAESARLLEVGVGGVVLFSQNITGAGQVRELTDELRRRAPGPLRIAIDHEGGHIVRIGAPLTRFPGAMALGAIGSESLVGQVAQAMARELAALGIDVNLAPVVDVAADPRNPSVGTRAFGSSVELVSRLGGAFVRGLTAGGVGAAAKHFPGHGRTPVDSHVDLPVLEGGLEALRLTDLPPFAAAIEAGVDVVMASHLVVDGLTRGLPASLSGDAITGLLRAELGFDGVVATDALRMGAVAAQHGLPAACLMAVTAGADVVMPLDDQPAALEALVRAAQETSFATRVADAARRLARLDDDLTRRRVAAAGLPSLPIAEHAALADEVARRSLTLCSDGHLLPIAAGTSVAVIEFPSRRSSPVEEPVPGTGPGRPVSLASALRRHIRQTREVLVVADGGGSTREAALDAARAADLVVCATRDAYLWASDRDLVRDLAALGRPVVLVALRNPYDVAVLDGPAERIAAYADVPATLEAVAAALTGLADWPGRLPMDLADASPESRP